MNSLADRERLDSHLSNHVSDNEDGRDPKYFSWWAIQICPAIVRLPGKRLVKECMGANDANPRNHPNVQRRTRKRHVQFRFRDQSASNCVQNSASYGSISGGEASKANCINRVYGAGDGNRIASQIFKPHRTKVLPAAPWSIVARCCQIAR